MAFAMRLSYFVIDTATGLGVTGLTASGSFTTLKVVEDGTIGSDIKSSATIQDDGAGNYSFAYTTVSESGPVKEVKVVPVMATATYQAVPVVVGAESLRQLADAGVTITANQAVNVAQWGGSNIVTPAVTGAPVVTLDSTEAIAELTADPGTTPTVKKAIMLLYMWLRNASTTTASAKTIKNNAGTTLLTQALSDDGTTLTQGKYA